MSEQNFHPFSNKEISGAIVSLAMQTDLPDYNLLILQALDVFAVVSTFALVSLALRMIWFSLKPLLQRGSLQPSREHIFFHTQIGLYAVCLLTGNFFSSFAGVIGIIWVANKGITEGK